MNKQELAVHLCNNGCVLTIEQIEELLTNFLNSELAQRRPKIDLLEVGIVEPKKFKQFIKDWNAATLPNEILNIQPNETQL
jgi:pimeloyl-CoA synthetase